MDSSPFVRTRVAAALAGALVTTVAPQVSAFDARSLALGGSTIADGRGLQGAVENPASLVAMQRRGERGAVAIGLHADVRDHGDVFDLLLDGTDIDGDIENLSSDLEDEVERLSGTEATCNPLVDDATTVCLEGVGELGRLAGEAKSILIDVDEEPVEGLGEARLGVAVTVTRVPFALHLGGRATGRGEAFIADEDIGYVEDFETAFGDDEITVGELEDEDAPFSVDVDGTNSTIVIDAPKDVLLSSGRAGAVQRTAFGASLATSLVMGGRTIDVGVTPRISRLSAWSLETDFRDAFDDTTPTLGSEFEDSKVSETSFTFDAGVTVNLEKLPVSLAAVLRNVVPESIETDDGMEFETTPQLVVGGAYRRGPVTVTSDIALNSAELDGIETQPFALGVEFGQRWYALRAGVGADFGREDDRAALTLGAKLGPLEIGGRVAGLYQGSVGAQIAFSF